MLFLAIALVSALIVGLGVLFCEVRRVNHRLDSYSDGVYEFFAPKADGQMSSFAEIVDQLGKVLGEEIRVTVTAGLQGMMGGTMKGINAALENEAMAENPQLALMEILPKSLKKKPLASMVLMNMLGSVLGGQGGNGNSNTGPVKFKL